MQTHEDMTHDRREFLESLKAKMDKMTEEKKNLIAGPEEKPLASWKSRQNGMHVRHMPDDEHGITRISVGGGDNLPVTLNYCTVRGGIGQCIKLLKQAIVALQESPE